MYSSTKSFPFEEKFNSILINDLLNPDISI